MTPSPHDTENQIRDQYHQEFGDPSSVTDLWSNIANRLPAQERPLLWWQHWLRVFASSKRIAPATSRSVLPRRFVVAIPILCVIVLAVGVVYRTQTLWSPHASVTSRVTAPVVSADTLYAELLQSQAPASIQQLGQNNQFPVPQTQMVNDDTVQIQQLVADTNNIVLGYTIIGNDPISVWLNGPVPPPITFPDGQLARSEGGYDMADASPAGGGKLLYPPIAAIATYDSPSLPGNPQQITLAIAIPVGQMVTHFTLTVPFSAGKTINISQTETSHGQMLTLDRAVLTSTATRFYYTTGADTILPIGWSATNAGKTHYTAVGEDRHALTGAENTIDFFSNLQDATGSWTIDATLATANGEDSWQFIVSLK